MSDQTPWLHERTWPEIKAYLERDDVVLLPVGSTEQHARHLPVMTDAAEAIAVAQGAGTRAGVLVAPPVWYDLTRREDQGGRRGIHRIPENIT